MRQTGLAGQLGRWAAVAAVVAGAWLGCAREAKAYQTVYWRSDAGTTNWWDGDNPWYRSSDGWWIARPDYKTYQNNTDIGPNIVHLDNANKPNMSLNDAYFQIGQLFFENATARTLLARGTAGMDFYNDGDSLDPKIENSSTGSHTIDAPIYIHDEALQINPVNGNLTFNKLIGNGGNWIDVWGNNGKTLIFKGVISGEGGMYIHENSHVTNTVAHTYTGETTVHAGRLGFMTNGAVASDITIESGGQMVMNKAATYPWSYAGNLSGAGSITKQGNFLWTLTGESSGYTGTMTIEAGPVTISRAGNWGSASANILMPGTGRSLRLSGGVTVKAGVSLGGATTNLLNLSGDNKITGTVTVGKNATIVTNTAGSLTMSSMNLASNIYFRGAGTTVVNNMSTPKAGVFLWNESVGGNLVLGGASSPAVNNIYLTVTNGATLTFSNTASAVAFTNANVTNYTGGKIILRKPTTVRQILIQNNANLDMYVLSNSEAAHFGVIPNQNGSNSAITFNTPGHTVYLKYTDGFDPEEDACWMIYEGRNANCISQTEANRITVNTDDLVSHGALGTFSGALAGGTNSYNKTAGSAVYVTYTAPAPQDPVGLETTTFTYNGNTITLTPNGGSGSGAYSMAFVSGGTGTGSFTASTKVLSVTKAGTFLFDVTRAASGTYPARTDRVTVTVNKGTQASVGLSTTTFTYNGSTITLTPNGGSGSGAYSMASVSGGTGTGTFNASTKVLTVTAAGTFKYNVTRAADNLWNSKTDAVTVTVNKGTQAAVGLSTTTFTYAGSGFTLSGNGGSGSGAYSYVYKANGTGSGSVSGSTLTPTAAGTMTVTVTRAADSLWNAKSADVTVTVNKGTQAAVGLSTTTFTYAGSGFTLSGNGGSGSGAYSYTYKAAGTGSGSVSGSTLTPTAAGTMTVTVTRAADSLWNAKSADVVVTVNKGTQTITGLSDMTKTYGDAAFALSASAPGTVTYTVSPSSVATVSGSTVTIAGAGSATITASAAATALYNANSATATLTVNKKNPTVTASVSPASIRVGGTATLSGTTDSGATLTYATSSSSIASLSGTTVTGVAYGTATLTVTSPATANYNEGSATCTITVRLVAPTTPPAIEAVGVQVNQFGVKTTGKGNAGAVLTLVKAGSAPTTPMDGTPWGSVAISGSLAWSSASAYPSGATDGTKVIINSTGNSFPQTRTITGASAGTHYYVTAFGFNHSGSLSGSNGSYAFLVPGTTIDFWTLSTEPSGAPGLTMPTEAGGTLGSGSATLNWTKGAGAGYTLVILRPTATADDPSSVPVDGQVYSQGASLRGGTVAYAGDATTCPLSGLTKLTGYTVVAYSYAMGADNSTANYGPASTGTFTTIDSNGPTALVTGVDDTGFLVSWTNLAAAANGFSVQMDTSSSFATWPWAVSNITFEGWTTGSSATTATDSAHGVSYGSAYVYNHASLGRMMWLNANGSWFRIDGALPAKVTKVTYAVVPGGDSNHDGRKVALQVQYPGESSSTWHGLCTNAITVNATKFTVTYQSSTPIPKGSKLRWYNVSSGSGGTVLLDDIHLEAESEPGFSEEETYLTAGSTYYVRVQNAPAASDWSDVLTVKAGVVPTGLAAGEATRDSVPFTWSGLNSPSGYRWQATTNAAGDIVTAEGAGETAGHAWPKVCDTDASGDQTLTLNGSFSTKGWRYWGTSCSKDGGGAYNQAAPGYKDAVVSSTHYKGHFLVGDTVMGIESTDFPVAGATTLKFSYTICAWNLNSVGATPENGRVNAYYRLDEGPWNFLGTGVPSGQGDGSSAQQTWTLTKGMLDGTNVAFRLELANGTVGYFTSDTAANRRMAGVYVQALKVYCTEKGLGDYTTLFDEGTDSGSATVEGLDPNCPVYFRVQALQGANVRSVWVEEESETSGFPGPTLLAANPVERYGFTANWTAAPEATGGYQIQWTRCGGSGAADTTVETCGNGSLTSGGDAGWRYLRPSGSGYPMYTNGPASKTWGHNMMVGVSSPSQKPAIASPEMDLSSYSGGYVQFSHWSRHNGYFAPDARVTLWYRTSSDGSSWGSWQRVADTPDLANATTIVTEQLPLPPEAVGEGKEHVQIRLSTEYSLSGGGSGNPSGGVYTGPYIKDIEVHGTTAGTPDYSDSCSLGHSAIIDVPAGTTLKEITGLAAGTPYYYHVRSVVSGPSYSDWSEGRVTTLSPMGSPENISATAVKQRSMTLVWPEADGATENTKYWVQASSCAGTAWSKTAVQPSSTTADLGEGDDWHYVGGGTEVTSSQQTDGHITGRGVYPAYAAGSEKSQVLAGEGTPGIESIAFSTVGASGGTLTFGHGRWYNASALGTAELTATYSIDGGETWESIGTSAGDNAKEFVTSSGATRTMSLPAAALGHASVIVRIEATTAAVVSSVPVGAAVGSATVTLTGNPGNYTGSGCKILDEAGLSYDQLTQLLDATTTIGGAALTANTPYYFRVCASDGLTVPPQYGAWVDGMAKTLDVPATPAAPWAVNIGRHTMTIRWTEAERAETYTLKVYSNSGCTTEVASFTGLTGTEQAVSGLTASKQYWFKVTAHSDGTSGSASSAGTATTVNTMSITGLSVTNILETTLTVKWDSVSGDTYTLDWGPVSDAGTESTAEEIPAPGSTLKRSDAGNGWSYFGGNGTYPAYWKGSTAGDEGHALIYATGGQPGIQSRWFSTFGVTNAVVDFWHGRFNSGADSTVVVAYSLDGGSTWSTAGTAESTSASTPTEHRQIALPAEALGKRSVMVRLTASGASGNKGAHVKDLKVVLQSGKGAATRTGVSVSGGTYTLSAPSQSIAAGTRYWFKLTATEGGETATAETTAATRTKTTGVLRSQGFEGSGGALDTSAWGYTISYKNVSGGGDAGSKTAGTQRPVVEVVSGQNPLYGDRALRMSGSANADVFGVVDFDNLNSSVLGSASANVTVTIPFAAQDLAQNDYLYVSYSTDNGSTWQAPGGTADQTSMGSVAMTRIGKGGSDVINRNWPYNRGTNTTTRPKGDAYTFELTGISQLKLRVAFCGQTGGAARYYFIDEVTVSLNPSAPSPVSASANASGNVDLTWTPATGQGAVIIRGQDMRNPPSFTDLSSLPAGYEVVTNASGGVFFENATRAWTDTGAVSGNKYFYYFYGAVPASGGGYSLSKTPNSAETIIKGMVNAIASQGWDGWDVHPWGYRVGRVTNPGRSSDYGWWKANGMNSTTVSFKYNEYEIDSGSTSDGTNFVHSDVSSHTYAQYYGTGAGASDADRYKQLGLTSVKSYIGEHSFRLSGGGSYLWSGDHVWVDYSGNTKTNSNVDINTNNAAIEFANVDLSGYKNVEFQMHFAGTNLNGGNDLHVAISTNGGTAGSWLEVGNDNAAGWKVVESHYDYGRAISDGDTRLGGDWDFYFEDSASATPYGNPYVLKVPDSVTQIMVRVMFYDSNGGSRRNASYFIDEVRLVGEVALETPHPIMTDISKTSFTATWEPIEGASSYNVKVTSVEATDKVKLTEAFALQAVPLQWKASASGVDFGSAASRSGKSGDYGLSLTAQNGWLASPEVGAANKVEFYVKASSSSAMTLALEASEDGETWELVKSFTASTVGTSWSKQTVELPRRQWEQIRFRKSNSTAGNWHIDDITIYGGGNYATTVTTRTGLTATNLTVSSGVSEGTEYFVSVQAYGAPNGVPTVSGWGETADYTPGTFTVKSDGFEMTRLGGTGSSSARLLVVAITDTSADYDDLPTPGVDTTVTEGTSLAGGKAVVVKNVTDTFSNFEHVWPHGSRTEPVEAKYVAFWKHGNYWEGRLETNVTLGAYVCQAADAMAITNSTAVPAGTQGKGWAAGWKPWDDDDAKASPDYISVLQSATTESGYTYYGLVGSNKLAGAGGNAIRFTMTDANRKLRLARALSAPVEDGEVWIMFQVRSQYGGDNDDKMFGMQLSTGTDATTAGGGIFASIGNMKYRYGDGDARAPRLQIDTSVDGSWPGGSSISWDQAATGYTPYELKDTGNQGSGTHTVVIKYDVGAKKIYAAGIYTTTAATIANNGPLAPNSTAPTFHCEATLSSKKTLGTIILLGKGYNGNLDFDEVRVGSSWQDIVGKETEAPFPVTSATAWTDGNELVRISWTYADEGDDGSIHRPLADGVRIYAREGTSGEWTEIYKGQGTNEAAVAAGGISRWDHVVAPGSTHQYKVAAYSSGKSATAVNAVNRDAAPSVDVTTGLYGETEYVNPFAYTNWSVASTTDGKRWLGGNGFGDNYWAPGSGSAGTWSIATPEEAQAAAHITNAIYGSRLAAGNVLKVVVDNGETASIDRSLSGASWCGSAGQTFYVAFRMAYQWGDQGGRQVGLRLTDDSGKYVQFGKARGDDSGYQHRFGVTASPNGTGYSSGWSTSGDDMTAYGTASDASRAYLVVGKVNWSANGKANLRGVKYVIGNDGSLATLPAEEKDVSWEASYDNAGIGAIRKIELIAGAENSGYGTIGTAWFDEIRFGTSWEDIVGATEPEDVWVEGIGVEVEDPAKHYLGDTMRWPMWGWRKGAKQKAWVTLAADSAFATVLATNDTEWIENTSDGRGGQQTKWLGREIRFTQTGTLYAGGSVKGELVTVNSWQRPAPHDVNGHKWNAYEVLRLPPPTVDSAVGGTAKVTLRWTPATENSRTFSEVMVVRYTGDIAAVPTPVQGTTYMKGQHIGTGTVAYRGTATGIDDKGLTKDTTYNYAFFTVNNSYYSLSATASAKTDTNDPEIEIDGDPGDWVGLPSEVKNSSTVSSGEWIWTDKVLDGRVDKPGAYDADITEFRIKVDNNGNVNFMARLHCLTNVANPYISVGIATNVDATELAATGNEDGENWIGDESATFMGGNLFDPASLHFADIQMAVHWVNTADTGGLPGGTGAWVVELYKKDGNSWYAPTTWEAASSTNGVDDPCIEWKVKRSDLGLDYANVTPARFTVASFANAGGWNNDTEATVDLSSGKSHAVDTLCIAPWGVNDKDLSLSAWDEGIQKGNAEYWFDIWFGPTTLHNAAPNAPEWYTLNGNTAVDGQKVSASPTMRWAACADHDDIGGTHGDLGFVVGYLVEVSTNEYFNGLEGTTENGPVSLRVNLKGADNTSYLFKTDSRYYWWRVRARDNSGALSAPTPWHYEVEGKTDNEGPVARLLFVGKDTEVASYVTDAAFRHEQDMSGDATSVLDSDLEDGGHHFGFVIEWYDVNGVFATNWYRASKDGEGDQWPIGTGKNPYNPSANYNPSVGDFAWSIQSHHGDGTPYGRVSPNWDLIIVDRSTVSHEAPSTRPTQPAAETVGGVSKAYTWTNAMVLPTDDGGTETIWGWIIDCGLDHVFQTDETICTGNDGQYITNHVQRAFSIGTYRTDLDIYLTVSAEDGCKFGANAYEETADYDWPLYADNGSTGSYQANNSPSYQVSGWCAAAPNPSRNVTTNQLLHIHVRDNDTTPPIASQAKWRAEATDAGGKVLLPMMAMTVGGDANAPGSWDPTWANLASQGRVPTQDGQGKALEWQLTDGDVSTYTHPSSAGGSGSQAWKGSAVPIRLFFNIYDEYLHSGLASFTAYSAEPTGRATPLAPTKTDGAAVTGSYISKANNTRPLYNTLLMLGTETNASAYKPAWSKITQFPWDDTGANTHGWGTGPDTVLAWQLDASEANVTNLVGRHGILAALGTGVDGEGVQVAFTNDVKLYAWDNDNNAVGDQEAAEVTFGRVLFSDDDSTPPEMASFTSLGTGTNFTHFGRLGEWTFGDSSDGPVFTATPLMSALSLSSEVDLHQYPKSNPTRHWNSSSHTIYYDGAGGRATDWNQTGAPYFEFTLKGDGNTVWNADMIGFENRVARAGPTLYALTVQAPTLALVNNAVADGAINTADDWTGANVDVNTYNSKEAIRLLTTSGSATFGPQACAQLTGLTVECQVAAYGSLGSTTTRKLNIQYKATGDADWTDLPGGSYTVSSFSEVGYGVYLPFSYDLANIPGLLGSGKEVQIRVYGTNLGSGNAQGYAVAGLKVTVARGDAVETLLGRMEIEKELDDTGGHFKTETVTSVIFGFDRMVQCALSDEHIFRLYAFDATRYNSDGVLEHLSDMPSSGGWTFTWGIKNLFLHGTATEPKHSEVTDYDVAKGAWTNNLEVLDGAMAGYDTVRSGLRVFDRTEVSGSTTNRLEYSGEAPSFRILYPSAYDGAAPNGNADGVVSGGELILRSVSGATFNHLSDSEFNAGSPTWTLSASGATVSGGKLTLAEGASAYAKQTVPLDAMSGVKSATVSGTVRARGTKAADAGGVNKLTVTAKVYSKANVLMKTLTEDIVTTSRAKNYAVGPWALAYDNVGSVEFTVAQTDATATELLVESLSGYVAQWGADITEADAAWATTVTNGMEAAKVLVRTPELDLRTVSVPLSVEGSGHSQPADQWYKLEATIHDYDSDRAGDALSTSAATNFWLYDDDVLAPQWGAKFDSPMGIFMGGTIISLKARRNSGADQIWPILDSDLTALAPDAEVLFSLSAYDYSGWKTTGFSVGSETIQSGDSVASAAATAGWSQTASEGAPESPASTNTWSITAKNLYTAHRTDFTANDGAGVTAELTANATDLDADRLNDSLATGSSRVGYAWFADQDVSAPGWGSQATPYYGVMISTGVGASAGLADLIGTDESPAPYALGGAANNQGEFSGRSYTVYDGQLKDAGAEGANQFVITANLNDPLPTGDGARARHPTGLKRGSTLTESAAMWGDSSDEANVFTVTNTHLVIQTPWTGGAGSLTNVAYSEAFTDPAIGKTRINTQAGHTSWAWTFPTNDIGKLLPPSETVAPLTLKVQAYDADANRHEDQKHAELVGPTITLRDDDTQAPTAPTNVTLTGLTIPSGTLTWENAPWTNNLTGVKLGFTAATDPAYTAKAGDIKTAGIARYRLAAPGATPGIEEGDVVVTVSGTEPATYSNLSVPALTAEQQGFGDYQLFAVDADADRPGDAMAGPAATVPLAYDITKPTAVPVNHGTGASTENVDDPTTQMDIAWSTTNVGPDDPSGDKTHYDAIPQSAQAARTAAGRTQYDVLSPWETYKVYYRPYDAETVGTKPEADQADYVYNTYIKDADFDAEPENEEERWKSVTKATSIVDPSAPQSYEEQGMGTLATTGVRLYDLDYDRHYLFVVVGVDKAGNEGPATSTSWATNDTIKFALTQGVVRAVASINSAMGTNTTALTKIGMQRIDTNTVTGKGAQLYWLASGQDARTGAFKPGGVTKQYDLIYRDAQNFTEKGSETWFMASSGTDKNSGTSQTNWNYQVDSKDANSITNLSRKKLRFYRASYHNRWQDAVTNEVSGQPVVKTQTPLASEEVYSMNRVPLLAGQNLVGLQGMPWTNTLAGVFGTDWPTGEGASRSTRVEFFDQNGKSAEVYWLRNDLKWMKLQSTNLANSASDDYSTTELPASFFARGFSITLPDELPVEYQEFTNTVNGTPVHGMSWYPILQVPTNGPAGAAGFSAEVTYGGRRDPRFTLVNLNLPVAVDVADLGLIQTDENGEWTGGILPGNGVLIGDVIYTYDNEHKKVRDDSLIYYSSTENKWVNSYGTGLKFYPNDAIVIKSMGLMSGGPAVGSTWTWTYSPTNFYENGKGPDRHMGR